MSQGGKEKRKREREEKKATSSHPHPPLLSFLVYVPDISPLFLSLLSAECVPSIQKINTLNHKKPTLLEVIFLLFLGIGCRKVAKLFLYSPPRFLRQNLKCCCDEIIERPSDPPPLIHYRKRERGEKARHHLSAPLRTFGGLFFGAGERKRMSSRRRRMRRWRRLFPSLVRIRIARAEEEEEGGGRPVNKCAFSLLPRTEEEGYRVAHAIPNHTVSWKEISLCN